VYFVYFVVYFMRSTLEMNISKFVLIAGFGLALGVRAQDSPAGGVGIDEKLGAQVDLDSILKDENGRDVTLRPLIDKPTILTLNYFRCAGICTPLLNSVADVLNQVNLSPGKDFQVITLSFDPRDTPEMALQKRANYLTQMKRQFPPAAWRFLTGDAQATKKVADSVGFRFRADGDQYIHPGAIMIITPAGIVSRYMYGISFLPADVEMAIQEAAGGLVRPTISKMLALCYSYDPEARRYVFNTTRVAGGIILVLAAAFAVFLFFQSRSRKKTRLPE
jgi:protein SCO1/2